MQLWYSESWQRAIYLSSEAIGCNCWEIIKGLEFAGGEPLANYFHVFFLPRRQKQSVYVSRFHWFQQEQLQSVAGVPPIVSLYMHTCIQTDVSLWPTLMPVPLSWICRSFSPPSFTVTWILVDLASRLQHCGQRAHVRGDKHTLYRDNPRLALSHNRCNYYTLRRVVDVTAPRCKQHWILVLKSHLDTQLLLSHNAK